MSMMTEITINNNKSCYFYNLWYSTTDKQMECIFYLQHLTKVLSY